MELRKEDIQMLRVKSRAASQVTFDMDYNVPDVKPDIGRMIQHKGETVERCVRLSDGKGFLKGSLNVDLLYVGEEEGRVCSLSAKLPIEEVLNLEGIENGDKMCLKWDIEDLSLHLIHSRKLNIKAVVTFYAAVDELTGVRLPVEADDDSVSVKKKTLRLLGLAVHKKDTLRKKEEITLASNKPNISRILWNTVEVRGLDLRPEEGVIKARGELFVFVLYQGDDGEENLQWLEHSVPFSGELECPGCTADMIPDTETSVIHHTVEVKPDADGEERIILADIVLETDLKLYREEEHDLIEDIYKPSCQCIPEGKKESLESLLVRNCSKCRLSDRVKVNDTQGKVLQICQTLGRVKVDKTEAVKDGIRAEGIVYIKILYIIGNDEMPFYAMDAMIPFTHVIEARGISGDCTYRLHADLEQMSTTMIDSDGIEIRATVSLNVLVIRRTEEMIIDRVEEQPLDREKVSGMPGITVYIVKPGDTLWDIAKRFYTTTEEIMEENGLGNEEIKSGQPLLLIKKVSE